MAPRTPTNERERPTPEDPSESLPSPYLGRVPVPGALVDQQQGVAWLLYLHQMRTEDEAVSESMVERPITREELDRVRRAAEAAGAIGLLVLAEAYRRPRKKSLGDRLWDLI